MSLTRPTTAKAGAKDSGAPGIENAAVERRKARPADRKAGRLLQEEQASRVRRAALCSLFEGANNPLPFVGAKSKIEFAARAEIPQRERRNLAV
jgi:hypothetical protein